MREENSRHYFNNLDGLRFFAASAVIVHHLEQFKSLAGLPSFWTTAFITQAGPQAVNFFFVLSGFLITHLLLKESEATGRISIKNFYLRRILRIWPLYFVTVILGFFVLPATMGLAFTVLPRIEPQIFATLLTLFLLFLPNLALRYPPVLGSSQCWSLGVEEQFYMIWPILLSFFKATPLRLLFGVIVLKMALTRFCFNHYYDLEPLAGYLQFFALEAMAAGGIAACWLMYAKQPQNRRPVILCAVGSLCAMFLLGYGTAGLTLSAYAIGILLAAVARPVGGVIYGPLQSLGKLSYGLYMLHTSAIIICLNFLLYLQVDMKTQQASVILYAGTFGLTLLLAYCSYKFFESPILKLKAKLAPAMPEGAKQLVADDRQTVTVN